jgi:hypothetical protein
MENKNVIQRLAAMGFTIMIMLPIGAIADNVQNDVVIGGTDTFTLGSSTTVSYNIHSTNGDGLNGCNAADGNECNYNHYCTRRSYCDNKISNFHYV